MKDIQPIVDALNKLNSISPGYIVEIELSGAGSVVYSLNFVSEDTPDGRVMTELFVSHNNVKTMEAFILGAASWVDTQVRVG